MKCFRIATASPFFLVLLAGLLLLGASSCTVRQDILLTADAAGTSDLEIVLHPVMTEYVLTLKETLAGELPADERKVFDLEEIRQSFALQSGIELVKAENPEPGLLRLGLRFVPLDRAFAGTPPGVREIFTLTREGGRKVLAFHLDRDNFDLVATLFPLYSVAREMYLIPDPGSSMSEAEYREYLVWALEGVAEGQDVGRIIDRSEVVVTVKVAGKLISQSGGTARGNSAVFRIPVVRALTLNEPLDYRLVFE